MDIYIYIIWICIYNQNQPIISYNIQWSYQLIMTAARQDHLDDNCPPWDHELNLYLCIEGGIGWYVCWCFQIPFVNGLVQGTNSITGNPCTGWWFGTFFVFCIYCECHHPNWPNHIFQRGGYTTNQLYLLWTSMGFLVRFSLPVQWPKR